MEVGCNVVGGSLGVTVGVSVGTKLGCVDGESVGRVVGCEVGAEVGAVVGPGVGPSVGFGVGISVVGRSVGFCDGVGATESGVHVGKRVVNCVGGNDGVGICRRFTFVLVETCVGEHGGGWPGHGGAPAGRHPK